MDKERLPHLTRKPPSGKSEKDTSEYHNPAVKPAEVYWVIIRAMRPGETLPSIPMQL
jgi:hypothetical protein